MCHGAIVRLGRRPQNRALAKQRSQLVQEQAIAWYRIQGVSTVGWVLKCLSLTCSAQGQVRLKIGQVEQAVEVGQSELERRQECVCVCMCGPG